MIAPVDVLKLKPAERDGEIAKVIGAVPPDAVTGVNDVAAVVAVSVLVAMARVVESAAEITRANVLALLAPLSSVAVTV